MACFSSGGSTTAAPADDRTYTIGSTLINMTTAIETADSAPPTAASGHNDRMPITPALEAQMARAAAELVATTKAREKAVQACRKAVAKAHSAGMTEVDLAVAMGVNRLTIRRWLGK